MERDIYIKLNNVNTRILLKKIALSFCTATWKRILSGIKKPETKLGFF